MSAAAMFQIKSRITSKVLFECELDAEVAVQSYRFRLGFAVRKAVSTDANLTGANLADANLTGANLTDANLTDANLAGANLTGANLARANLTGANLADANLTGANLAGANLAGANLTRANLARANLADANLTGANLARANLTGANLTDANLTDANLAGANLTGANLADANLTGANLADANLAHFRSDMIAEILKLPDELEALRTAIIGGLIDGSSYSGDCACLAGTLAKARGLPAGYSGESIVFNGMQFIADSSSPRERWFMMIKPGDTPDTNQASRLALEWVNEAIAIRDIIRKSAVVL